MISKNKTGLLIVLSPIILFIVLFGTVVLLGGTFGQRCSEHYVKHSVEWEACINRLSKG